MFVLATLKDTVKILPHNLGKDFSVMLINQLNRQLANYVIPNVGLCITFYEFKNIGQSFLLTGDASTHTPVAFRYVIFQPFVGEILEGVISRSNSEGVTISMNFFHDIFVPTDKLPSPSKFHDSIQLWSWEYSADDEQSNVTSFFIDPGKIVRFKVVSVQYNNIEPGTPPEQTKAMEIKASMLDTGLGVVNWWEPAKQEPDDEE